MVHAAVLTDVLAVGRPAGLVRGGSGEPPTVLPRRAAIIGPHTVETAPLHAQPTATPRALRGKRTSYLHCMPATLIVC